MSQGNAFDFIARPARSQKPRKTGVTVASDKGLSKDEARSFIETAGDILDHVKCPDHVGILWRYDPNWIREKNAIYKEAGIDTLPGGVPFEVAAMQGKVPAFMKRVSELGFTGVEVSEDSIDPLPPTERVAAIKAGLDCGLHVFTEMGKKDPESPMDLNEAIEMSQRDLDAGAHMVVIEKSDVSLIIKNKTDVLHKLMEAVGPEKLIIEAGPGADELDVAGWLMQQFGPEVNLENIRSENTITIEAMRAGLNRAVNYAYFHQFRGKGAPPING